MSRRSETALAQLDTVASTYSAATNVQDFAEAKYHRLTVLGDGAGQLVFCVLSKIALSDGDAATALADAARRFAFVAADPAVTGVDRRTIETPFPFRYAYFLTDSGTADLYLEAEQG